jgi:drug/metabolite transporter (DMT)-like permease
MKPTKATYHFALLFTVTIWASTFVSIKIVLLEVPPNTLALLRFLIASVALALYLLCTRQPVIKKGDWPMVILCGMTGVTIYNFLQNQGLKYAGSVDAAILTTMAPVFMALLGVLFLKEKIEKLQIAGIILAVAGSILVATNGSLAELTLNSTRLYGDILILLTTIAWAVYSIIIKVLLEKYPATTVMSWTTFAGTILLLPLSLLERPFNLGAVQPSTWLHIFYLGLFASALGYLIWNHALTRITAVVAGVYLYLIPVITAIFAFLFIKEIPGTYSIAGGCLILLGTYLTSRHEMSAESTEVAKN